jgi:N-acetylglucosamine-6-sulfatase
MNDGLRTYRAPVTSALTVALIAIIVLVLTGTFSSSHSGSDGSKLARLPPQPAGAIARGGALTRPGHRPNIVFVLTDDLSMDLVPYMPQVQALESEGATFENQFVTDSVCCASRSSIFTGEYPHNSHVYTNLPPNGGFSAFVDHGDLRRSFNVDLQRAGYTTAMMGKYLNGYLEGAGLDPFAARYIPRGWNQWDVAGKAYSEFDYRMNQNGRIRYYGSKPRDYLTDVLGRLGTKFIDRASRSRKPFFLELATFAPHEPYVPAPRYRNDFRGLQAPRPPDFDVLPTNAPTWLRGHKPFDRRKIDKINAAFRLRVQDVQSIDDMIATIETALAAHHELRNTDIVFSSDNGLHTGEHRLMPGKLTAFTTDIQVPLVIAGPGIPAGSRIEGITENIDFARTFEALAGTSAPSDGTSLLPLLHGHTPANWQDAVLVEHRGPVLNFKLDPDAQNYDSGNPTSYEALRTTRFLYVEYDNGQHEYYDLTTDPYELYNVYDSLSSGVRARLHRQLGKLERCRGARSCGSAEHLSQFP